MVLLRLMRADNIRVPIAVLERFVPGNDTIGLSIRRRINMAEDGRFLRPGLESVGGRRACL